MVGPEDLATWRHRVAEALTTLQVKTEQNDTLRDLFDKVANELRSPRLRTELGQSALPGSVVAALQMSDLLLQGAALRVLGNLCIDHGTLLFLPQLQIGKS